jgi:sec-independent protein translocase protein TatA
VRREHLDRDFATEARVPPSIDLSHAAGPEGRQDFIGTELRAGGECHLSVAGGFYPEPVGSYPGNGRGSVLFGRREFPEFGPLIVETRKYIAAIRDRDVNFARRRRNAMGEGLLQPQHLLLILIIAIFVFGPRKLPELGKGLGEAIRGFRKAMHEAAEESSEAPAEKE